MTAITADTVVLSASRTEPFNGSTRSNLPEYSLKFLSLFTYSAQYPSDPISPMSMPPLTPPSLPWYRMLSPHQPIPIAYNWHLVPRARKTPKRLSIRDTTMVCKLSTAMGDVSYDQALWFLSSSTGALGPRYKAAGSNECWDIESQLRG